MDYPAPANAVKVTATEHREIKEKKGTKKRLQGLGDVEPKNVPSGSALAVLELPGARGERVNEVPRKEAGCQLGSVTHWQLFPRVPGKETLEKPWALVCQHGEAFLEERMCRDWDSKEEAEGRTELNLGFAL